MSDIIEQIVHLQDDAHQLKLTIDKIFDRIQEREAAASFPQSEIYEQKQMLSELLDQLGKKIYNINFSDLTATAKENANQNTIHQLKKDIQNLDESRQILSSQSSAALNGLQS